MEFGNDASAEETTGGPKVVEDEDDALWALTEGLDSKAKGNGFNRPRRAAVTRTESVNHDKEGNMEVD